MNILNKLEKKLGKFAIPNLTKWIILTYIIAYGLYYLATPVMSYLYLEPAYIVRGQIWRIISWILVPPTQTNIFFVIIMLLFYSSIGKTLENTWGTFRYNFYIFSGLIFTIIGAFVVYFIQGDVVGIGYFFSTHYINLAIFLAFAATYPDMQVMLYFIIPIKIRWLGYLDIALIVYDFIKASYWGLRVAIVASLLNFILFFLISRGYVNNPRAKVFKQKKAQTVRPDMSYKSASGTITKHKCAICGRTENDGIELEFRFCTKCNGNYEYCQEHLFTHTHIQ